MRDIFKSIERNRKDLKKLQDMETTLHDMNRILERNIQATMNEIERNKKLIAECQQLRKSLEGR